MLVAVEFEDGEDIFMALSTGPPKSQKGFGNKTAKKYARGVALCQLSLGSRTI